MADKTQIEWSDATWNVVTGCSRVSAGCERCYAERLAATRLRHLPSRQGLTDHNGRWNGKVRFNEEWLGQPLRWQRPRRIFVCAHGDLFHEEVPDSWIDLVFTVMATARRHDFQLLTKRPLRMQRYMRTRAAAIDRASSSPDKVEWPLPNVWPGVSVEDQPTADERGRALRDTPAAVRWISAEPLLAPVVIDEYLADVDWVVVGGESGPGARPMDPAWARSLRDQCISAGTAFFFKQWGGSSAKSGGRELDGRTWDEMPPGRAARG